MAKDKQQGKSAKDRTKGNSSKKVSKDKVTKSKGESSSKGSAKKKAAQEKMIKGAGKKHDKKFSLPQDREPTKKELKEFTRLLDEALPYDVAAYLPMEHGIYSIDSAATVITYTPDPGSSIPPRALTDKEQRSLIDEALGKMGENRGK